jgi:hypothetical protein
MKSLIPKEKPLIEAAFKVLFKELGPEKNHSFMGDFRILE